MKKKISQLVVYVVFYLKNSTCLNAPINLPLCTVDKSNTNASGIAHLLLVTHKFPAAKNVCFIVLSITHIFLVLFYKGVFLISV